MVINIIETQDAGLLAELNRDVQELHADIEPGLFKKYAHAEMRILFENILKDENNKGFVAYDGDRPAGYALVSKVVRPETPYKYASAVLYVNEICVAEGYIGKGIGKALMLYVKEFAKQQDIKRIELDYWRKNANAGKFFASQGFTGFQEKMFYDVTK